MKIRILLADPLIRFADGRRPPAPVVVLEYVDRRSKHPAEALDVAWRLCNAHLDHLDEAEARLRDVWDGAAGGLGLSVGDFVEVDGARFRCQPEGWRPV